MSQEITDKSARELFGDGQTATNTREKILDRAADLFYTYGIHAVGIDRILKEVSVTKTSFYNHFESKDEMTCEVLRRRHTWEWNWFLKAVEGFGDGTPAANLLAIFDVLDRWFTDADFLRVSVYQRCRRIPLPERSCPSRGSTTQAGDPRSPS